MKRFRFLAAALIMASGSLTTATSANAVDDEDTRRDPVSRMMNLDRNEDGKISKEEAPERLASMFARADSNEDGLLDEAEIRKVFAARVSDRVSDRGPQFGDRENMRGRGPEREGRGPRGDEARGQRGRSEALAETREMKLGERNPAQQPSSVLMMAIDRDRDGSISEKELANAAKALLALDKNEDGVIDAEELRPRRRGPGDGDSERRGPQGRSDGDRPEVAEAFRERMRERFGDRGPGGGPSREGFIEMMLERMDQNNDGKLSGDEIPERMASRLKQIDKNEDGEVDRKELEVLAEQFQRGRGNAGDRPGPGADGPGRRGDPEGSNRRRGERPPVDKP